MPAHPDPPTLLVLRALNFGDLLVAVPALRALRRHHAGHRLLLATNPALGPIAALTGAVDAIVPHRDLSPPPVHAPEIAVDLHGVLPHSVRALLATRPGRLTAFACPEAGHTHGPAPHVTTPRKPAWDLTTSREPAPDITTPHEPAPDITTPREPDPSSRSAAFPAPGPVGSDGLQEPEHEVARWCRLVRWAGAEPDEADLLLAPPPLSSPRPGATIVHPGAAHGSKRWPAARFAAVARTLAAGGHDVVVTGSPAERDLAARVTAAAGLPGGACLAGRTTLDELIALVHGAALVVSGDTGVAHLASAYERPSVVLFGPASPRIWGPPRKPVHAALWHGTGEREVLTHVPDPALLAITPEEVLAAVATVLAAHDGGPDRPRT
ncbi:glycosyltransferase family 9 protein [Nonomuraea candida]|uniref:glycosyltransferase family 9 protein n=1 Tax=Nonomuraea candida TaxID=359159 RepID=UPI0005BAB9FC|nr:glycosyltransferase family 9 protein [Nonomuraea candida]